MGRDSSGFSERTVSAAHSEYSQRGLFSRRPYRPTRCSDGAGGAAMGQVALHGTGGVARDTWPCTGQVALHGTGGVARDRWHCTGHVALHGTRGLARTGGHRSTADSAAAELNRAHTSERAARHSTHRRKDDEPLLRKVRTTDGCGLWLGKAAVAAAVPFPRLAAHAKRRTARPSPPASSPQAVTPSRPALLSLPPSAVPPRSLPYCFQRSVALVA
jgi:hypothetical protein